MKIYPGFDDCVDFVIDAVGPEIVIGIPLGLGKPNRFINALYQRAKTDAAIQLTICTALTLEKPLAKSELERRFLEPFVERVFGDYVDLDYASDRRRGKLPDNVEIIEFFFAPGQMLGNADAQQNFVASNYTHVARDMLARGINVLGQLVSSREVDGRQRYSLSSNPDVSLELAKKMRAQGERKIALVAEVNQNLPFMYRDAMVESDFFDAVVETPEPHFRLFGTPRPPLGDVDHMIGLYASTLVPDGGTLQIGIGSLGDAIASALILREENAAAYRSVLDAADAIAKHGDLIDTIGGTGRFENGLFAATEMLVDGILQLYKHAIVKRKVYDDLLIQTLINEGRIDDDNPHSVIRALLEEGLIPRRLNEHALEYLQQLGVIDEEVAMDDDCLVCGDGQRISADLSDPASLDALAKHCLGSGLRGGSVIHGGFFLGPQDFYAALAALPREESELICMTGVDKINQLYGREELDTLQRKHARFINSCLMVSLLGSVISDTLDSGEVVSGVGGQYNFVSMAHAIPGGRSIIMVKSTRESAGRVSSNIVWKYGRATIPRHLRDIVISEYGIADLRSKTDSEVIGALLDIADSRFQESLRREAVAAGKLPRDYRISARFRNNFPHHLQQILADARADGHFGRFPFGTELSDEELRLAAVLKKIKAASNSFAGKTRLLRDILFPGTVTEEIATLLKRMGLDTALSLKEKIYRRLLIAALAR
ncbi:MAG: acetyl-CoA hydrolase [Gammaproteobacteria bacterium]|nr:acetyl-CoA hydrolase [Gammaproteobacteria bacterium]